LAEVLSDCFDGVTPRPEFSHGNLFRFNHVFDYVLEAFRKVLVDFFFGLFFVLLLLTLVFGGLKPSSDFSCDIVLHFSKLFRLVLSGRLEVHTVTTVFTLDIPCLHPLLILRQLPDTSEPPRIVTAIREVNIRALDIKPSKEVIDPMNLRLHGLSKYPLAVVLPEFQIYFIRTERELIVRHLKESKLVTVLISPLSLALLCVNSSVT
jgi:hypothetical protein